MELLPPGDFQRDARMVTDPTQIALFRLVFDSLRIRSPLDFFLRVSLNLSICFQFSTITKLYSRERMRTGRDQQGTDSTRKPFWTAFKQHGASVLLLLAFSTAILAATISAVTTSQSLCSAYPECVAYAHRWSSNKSCPCIVYIDVDLAPKTYEIWMNPPSATETLRNLSYSEDLRIVSIINRQLVTWPEEIRACVNLQQMYACSGTCRTLEVADVRCAVARCTIPVFRPFLSGSSTSTLWSSVRSRCCAVRTGLDANSLVVFIQRH